ncbi:hypothetical protein CACET_c15140 [Clostridium aceticum]|uniref:Uncharacterized protein n=1 Tax=Clostridium aceticum TaxID=84022 RepID=A0A0G3W9F0_9CLOT|nr:hypothetical protein [Clostridium aceticum]AKL94963.1 hypothetical protein CACET_c15140 [Clostridium aceticum]
MKSDKKYVQSLEIHPIRFENIEEKQVIHQYENRSIEIDPERLKGKKTINEIR